MTHDITQPLRLAVGSHKRGSGKGCAMNVISWENGDTEITDLPACSDPLLARIVQRVNDRICIHRDGDLLCTDCSVKVLELGHRTVGTGTLPLSRGESAAVYAKIAADQAAAVAHLKGRLAHLKGRLAHHPGAADAANYAADAADAAAYAAADANAADAAAYAAIAAVAAAAAAYAAAANAYAAAAADARLRLAHRAIDLFEKLTAHVAPTPDPAAVEATYHEMIGVSA